MVNTLDFGGVRTAVFREARTDCIRDFCQKGHKQKATQHPPKPNATSKYFSWDIPSKATTTVRKLPNCNPTTSNRKRKLPERPSQYYTSLEVRGGRCGLRLARSSELRRFLSRAAAGKTSDAAAAVTSLACGVISRLERRLDRIQRRLERLASLREEEMRVQGELIKALKAKQGQTTTPTTPTPDMAFSRHWTGLEILRHGARQFVHVDESDYIAARISNLVEFCISPSERLDEANRISVQEAVSNLISAFSDSKDVDTSEFHRRRRRSSSKSQRKRKRSSSGKNNGNKSSGAPTPARKCENKEQWDEEPPPPKIEDNPICDTTEEEVIRGQSRLPEAAAPDCPFDIDVDGDELVIDEEGDDEVDVGHATELFSPVIVSTCSLNKKEGRRSSLEDERPRLQSDESSKASDMLELRNLRRKYHNPVRSLCVKFEEILRQVVEFSGSAFLQRTLKRTASTSSSSEDSPESSSGSQSPAAFTLRCSDLSFKLTSSCFETLEGFRTQLEKAVDASLANCPGSDYNVRGILLSQFDRLVEANLEHIRLLEKLINPALFEDGVTRLNFILMAVVEAKNVAPLVARISKLRGNTVDAVTDKILTRRYECRDHFIEDVEWIALWAEEVHGDRSKATKDAREMVRAVRGELALFEHCFF